MEIPGKSTALRRPHLPDRVTVYEVGPRDGLQNEPETLPVEVRVAFIDRLTEAGLPAIEVGSFVSPKAIPQLADTEEVFGRIRQASGVRYPVLVPNERGLERALAAGVREIAVFTAASETFNRKNIHAGVDESIERFRPWSRARGRPEVRVRGYVSTAFGCPYEGDVAPEAVREVVHKLLDLGVDEISIGDTIGVATPGDVYDGDRGPLRVGRHARGFSPSTFTTRAGPRSPTSSRASSAASRPSTPRRAALAAARTRRAPRATSRPRTSCTCSTASASQTGVTLSKVVEASRYLAGSSGGGPRAAISLPSGRRSRLVAPFGIDRTAGEV